MNEIRRRARSFLPDYWRLPTGTLNAICDVPGVRVGHTTLIAGEGALTAGEGPIRTGVTVILPHGGNLFQEKVSAAVHTINGFGKACGFEQVRELGVIETPIALTNTLNTWLVADALAQHAIRNNPAIGVRTGTVNPVVGETNDGYLNDIQGRHVKAVHVWQAIENARGDVVAEGSVGAGTGTTCFGWKGGIGSASRLLQSATGERIFTLGVLVQSNFGAPEDLRFGGELLGQRLLSQRSLSHKQMDTPPPDPGSIMIVLATDAPLDSRQLHRLCGRAVAGLARTGSTIHHGSGDFVIAFSTARNSAHQPDGLLQQVSILADEEGFMQWAFSAVVECVEEAVLNSLCMATTIVGRDGHVRVALPVETILPGEIA